MSCTVIVGGQYGSEGKGKVANFIARRINAKAVIRSGGANSGHTVIDESGKARVFKQLPTACINPGMLSVLVPGTYIDLSVLEEEIHIAKDFGSSVVIDPKAVVLTDEQIEREQLSLRCGYIGSTGRGMAEAITDRVHRLGDVQFARDVPGLAPYLENTAELLRGLMDSGEKIVLEGTQGFGLSLLHSGHYPYVTSRDTTAAVFASEAGISPFDIDEIVMVLRTYPIRVAGNSGPLQHEISWEDVTKRSGSTKPLLEYTTVTQKMRRVGAFEYEVVKQAIRANQPSRIVLNHLDYIHPEQRYDFVSEVESVLERHIDWVGLDQKGLIQKDNISERKIA